MIINVLKSVLKMLDKPNKSKIECARLILEQVVEHLEKGNDLNQRISLPPIPGAPPSDGLSPAGEAARADLIPEQ